MRSIQCRPPCRLAVLFVALAFASSSLASVAAAPAAAHVAERSYRPMHGSEILWDRYGVAHVYARSIPDLFFGFGWAQARSHGDLLARLYAEARGRAAELYGQSELASDRWMAINDVHDRARRWLQRQTPLFRRYLEAFAAGIDAYARAHPRALSSEARRVLPVTALDVIAYEQRIFQFTYAAPASVLSRLPPDGLPAARQAPVAGEAPGSNAWAIAPRRSASGHAMLLMNPHLPWQPGWSTYYEIQLVAPGVHLYGATQVGLPVLRFVFSDRLGFTHTVNAPSAVTFYRVTPAPGGYRFDGEVLPYATKRHVLKVREPDGALTTETLTVRSTVQGPIVAERGGAPIAMRVAGLDRPFALDQYWQMATARDFAAFQAAVARLEVPTFNIVYADRAGHIEYLYNGLVPRHPFGDLAYWSGIVPGDTSRTLWKDYLSFDELPKIIDPPGGTVQNSNDPPWDAAWPQVLDPARYASSILPFRVDLRMERGIRMLSADPKLSFERLVEDKWSHRSELADRVLSDLLAAAARYGGELGRESDLVRRAAAVLARWDRSTDAESRGALLFLDWVDQPGAASGYSAAAFARPFDIRHPLTTPAGLRDPRAAVRALDAAARDMLATYGALDVRWGDVMRLRIGAVDLPASGGPGRLGVFDVLDFGPRTGRIRAANFGDTYVALVSFDDPPRAKVLLSYGSSSQPGSPHRSDQLPLLARGRLRDAWLTRAEVEAHLESRDRF